MRAFAGVESGQKPLYHGSLTSQKESTGCCGSSVFLFTANQEKEHAEIFYKHLTALAEKNISIDGNYPVDISQDVAKLLRFAEKNEMEEHDDVYKAFEEKAREEGFTEIAASFHMIGKIEKTHGERFRLLAQMLESNTLFVSEIETSWMCLKCGNIYAGLQVPEKCPVCGHDRGYYIRLELLPCAVNQTV